MSYVVLIGSRYSFTRKRNRFTSLVATISMLGMVIGVASLITVLAVMNGFAGELQGRILSLVPHGFVEARDAQDLQNWQALTRELEGMSSVEAVSPYLREKVILGSNRRLQGAVLTAIDPSREQGVSRIAAAMPASALASLDYPAFNVVLGAALARSLGVYAGDTIEVTVPRLTVTPAGVFPRSKRLTVTGTFEVGAQPDSYQAYVALTTGQKLFGNAADSVDGLQVRTQSLQTAPAVMRDIDRQLQGDYRVKDWSETQGTLFAAVKMEKMMVSFLLLSVVAVAAFNIVSTLVMSVTEKRRDIAVLRTMGASPGSVMAIFVAHGLILAVIGVGLGACIGVFLALNIAQVTSLVEVTLGVKLFDPAVYFISELPATLQWADVLMVVVASLSLSLLATLYPAWRAASIAPAEVLRYE